MDLCPVRQGITTGCFDVNPAIACSCVEIALTLRKEVGDETLFFVVEMIKQIQGNVIGCHISDLVKLC